jgi:hypothetical protein
MATAAHTTVAPALNSAANDTATDWTKHPLARRILASFATNPPPLRIIPRNERWEANDTEYTGFRVDCLCVIRSSVIEPAFRSVHQRGELEAAARIAASASVTDAVESALRIQPLYRTTTPIRQLDPAIWGSAL